MLTSLAGFVGGMTITTIIEILAGAGGFSAAAEDLGSSSLRVFAAI
jgi:hypothetical protein